MDLRLRGDDDNEMFAVILKKLFFQISQQRTSYINVYCLIGEKRQ